MATRQESRERARRDRAAREQAAAAAERRRKRRGYVVAGVLAAATVAAVVLVLTTAGGGGDGTEEPPAGGADAGHIHGLGVDPRHGALFVATHTGLFRAARGQAGARRVGRSDQDIMGFSVPGPDRFLASGHPGSGQDLPPLLGLIESRDGGRTWKPISLLGEADFHVLRSVGERVYGFDSANGRFLASSDGGRTWDERDVPGPLVDLAIDRRDPDRLVASTESGLHISTDAGRRWRPLGQEIALLAWSDEKRLFLLDGEGRVKVSANAGRTFAERGRVDGDPVAFVADGGDLYVGLDDGRVLHSTDEGASWSVRATL